MILYLENETEKRFDFDLNEIAVSVIEKILQREKCPYETEVNLLVTDNKNIRDYNKSARGIDKETDVLSFPNLFFQKEADFNIKKGMEADYTDPETGKIILGDIIISAEKVTEQADLYGHSEKREFAFLVAHSMLHLCGYDHTTKEESEIMEKKQSEALEELNITRDIM